MKISLDVSLFLKQNLKNNGLEFDQKTQSQYVDQYAKITQDIIEQNFGFIRILDDQEMLKKAKVMFDKYSSWAKKLIVVGIGGSDLGARMLQGAIEADKPPMQTYFVGDSTDPEQYFKLFENIDPKTTLVNIISKSGSTIETATGYLLLKKRFQDELGDNWYTHFIFTTDANTGIMRDEAKKFKIDTLEVPNDVGGRFSVLTHVGLFPALAMGIDIDQLILGAKKYLVNAVGGSQQENQAWMIALGQFLMQKQNSLDMVVMMPYIWRMNLFGNWFRQLWAESLGKDGKGILPIKAIGPADQHSQVQFYNQGKLLSSFLFIKAKHYNSLVTIQNQELKNLMYLHHTPLEDIIRYECEATQISLAENDRPSMTLEIESLDEIHLGALIILFEISVVYLAKLLDVNPFDQPGVEAGKKYMYGLLGREGFSEKAEEIESFKNKLQKQVIEVKD